MISEQNSSGKTSFYVPPCSLEIINFVVLAIIFLSVVYDFLDLYSPGHFVGDMYGLEVAGRVFFLLPVIFLGIWGIILCRWGTRKGKKGLYWVGSFCAWISLMFVIPQVVEVFQDRRGDALHKTYPQKSVEDLTRLVREEKDQFVLDELIIKRTPASIQVVKEVLTDENEKTVLRICAAGGLSQLDDKEADHLLQETELKTKDEALKIYLTNVRKDKEWWKHENE